MASLPEQADLLDDSRPSDAAFQRKKFSIDANKALLPSKGSKSTPTANPQAQTQSRDKSVSCCSKSRRSCRRALWSLRFQRPWEWLPWLQTTVFASFTLLFFILIGQLPARLGLVGEKQLPTTPVSGSDALFEARFEASVADLSFNVFSPSPGAAYSVMSCGMFFVVLILLTML